VYEALLREGMDAEQSEKFDEALDKASSRLTHVQVVTDERAEALRLMGGDVTVT
jgi:hypothetical protein